MWKYIATLGAGLIVGSLAGAYYAGMEAGRKARQPWRTVEAETEKSPDMANTQPA